MELNTRGMLVALVLLVGGLLLTAAAPDSGADTATDGWSQRLEEEKPGASDGWAQQRYPERPVPDAHDGWSTRVEELAGPTVRQPVSVPATRGPEPAMVAIAIALGLVAVAGAVGIGLVLRRRPALRASAH